MSAWVLRTASRSSGRMKRRLKAVKPLWVFTVSTRSRFTAGAWLTLAKPVLPASGFTIPPRLQVHVCCVCWPHRRQASSHRISTG
ncbi:hypothetical protein D3C75_1066950 [compost metagenome]